MFALRPPRLARLAKQLTIAFRVERCIHAPKMNIALRAEGQRPVGRGKGGDVVLSGLAGIEIMLRGVAQSNEQSLFAVIGHRSGLGRGDLRRGRVCDVGDEKLSPVGCAGPGTHVLNIDDGVFEVLIEDARLNFEGCLRVFERRLQLENRAVGARGNIQRVRESKHGAKSGDNCSNAHEIPDAQPRGAHGDNLRVRSKATQP